MGGAAPSGPSKGGQLTGTLQGDLYSGTGGMGGAAPSGPGEGGQAPGRSL